MTSSATVLPPPLTDPPSVEALERLLAGLHQPMQRGVPSPPATDRTLDLTVLEVPHAAAAPVAPPSPPPPPPPPTAELPREAHAPAPSAATAPQQPVSPPSLSWSAGTARREPAISTTAAVGVALAAAAGALVGLAAAGELALP